MTGSVSGKTSFVVAGAEAGSKLAKRGSWASRSWTRTCCRWWTSVMSEAVAVIHDGRVRAIQRRHPWVFSGAIMRLDGDPAPGDIVTVAGGRASSWHAGIGIRSRTSDPAADLAPGRAN